MTRKRFLSGALALALLLGTVFSLPVALPAFAEELTNVALGMPVNATSDYIAPEGFFNAQFLTDGEWETYAGGNVKLGWNSVTTPGVKENDPVDITVTLDGQYQISEIILKPMKWSNGTTFPRDFELMLSVDGEKWVTVATEKNASAVAADNLSVQPKTYEITPTSAQYFRIHITRHSTSTDANTGSYYSAMGEVELMGKFDEGALDDVVYSLNKPALRMQPGEYDQLKLTASIPNAPLPDAVWSSDDERVAAVDENGRVTAVGYGETILRSKTDKGEFTCHITVDDYSVLDNLMITTFRSPSKKNLTPETYDLLKAAGFTNIQNEWNTTVNTVADNLLMAQYSYERGMDITASLGEWRDGFAGLSYEEVQERVSIFSHVPGVGGIYVLDEPYNANPYASVFKPIKDLMPHADVHLNFLPLGSYGDEKLYAAQINDLYQLTEGRLDYLMYDHYPFNTTPGYMNEASWYQNLDVVRKLGLKTGAKTGTFILSISMNGGYRRPTGDEIRFEMYSAMAFGYKQLAYFCWETPHEAELGFGPAIVDVNGVPTEIYEPVKEVNNEALKLGPTLMKLECVEPYIVGSSAGYGNTLPADFFLKPNGGAQLLVTHMRDPETGEDYCFVVNRKRYEAQTVTLTPAAYIASMQEVSNQTGELEAVTRNADGTYTVALRPGAGRLFKMPDTCDYTPDFGKFLAEKNENLAADGNVRASGSVGADGFYQYYANDGERFSRGKYIGWDSTVCPDQKAWMQVDLGGVTTVNRVDLYPTGSATSFGLGFPTDFTIDVSEDGETWKTVVTVKEQARPTTAVPSFTFNEVSARYVRVSITGMQKVDGQYRARISEIEVYDDDGSVPPPDSTPYVAPDAEPGSNMAPDATVIYSSSYEYPPYWGADQIHDGNLYDALSSKSMAGWSSDEQQSQDATEWIGFDLGSPQVIREVKVFNAFDTTAECFPIDYHVEVSMDGKTWQTVAEVTGDDDYAKVGERSLSFMPVEGRYVRFVGTKLSSKNGQAPFRMQLSEMQVIAGERIDRVRLTTAIAEAERLELSLYTAVTSAKVTEALTALKELTEDPALTGKQASDAYETLMAALGALELRAGSGDNLAAGKKVLYSSAYQEAPYWLVSGINDGRLFDVQGGGAVYCGWSSNINVNPEQAEATEWIGFDLGKATEINRVVVYAAKGNTQAACGFPFDFVVEVSEDGKEWSPVYTRIGVPDNTNPISRALNFAPVTARYVRFRGTKLAEVGKFGYMLQLSELEVYGTQRPAPDSVDTSLLEETIRKAEALDPSAYAPCDERNAFLENLELCKKLLTDIQGGTKVTQADIDAQILLLDQAIDSLVTNGKPAEPEGDTEGDETLPDESDTDSSDPDDTTEPDTAEPDTAAPEDGTTGRADTTPEEEPSESEKPADKQGCGSALGFGALWVMLAAALGCLLLRRHRRRA